MNGRFALFGTCLLVATMGCGPKVNVPGGDSDTDTDTVPEPHPDDGAECAVWETEDFKRPGIMCGGECVDYTVDSENCGACGHRCETAFGMTLCSNKTCAPAGPTLEEGCVLPDSPFQNCDEVCESFGSPCVEGEPSEGGCPETLTYWIDNEPGCESLRTSRSSEPTTCETLFDFSVIPSIGAAPTGASCCCVAPN